MRPILASIIFLLSLSNSQAQGQQLPGSTANALSHQVTSGGKDGDRQNLATVSALWSKYWMAKQLDQVIDLYAPDAVFLTGTGDRFTGKAAIRKLFKTALETNTSNITFAVMLQNDPANWHTIVETTKKRSPRFQEPLKSSCKGTI